MSYTLEQSGIGPHTSGASIDDVLPREVLDAIFEIVREAEGGLRDTITCSVVSREWRWNALRHVFCSLSLIMQVDRENLPDTPAHGPFFLQNLVHWDVFPQIQHSVKSLKLRWGASESGSIGLDFAQFLPLFPALRTLELNGWLGGALYFPSTTAGPSIPFLSKLLVRGHAPHPRQHDPRALCSVLSTFGVVEEVELENMPLPKWSFVDEERLKGWRMPCIITLTLKSSIPSASLCSILKGVVASSSGDLLRQGLHSDELSWVLSDI